MQVKESRRLTGSNLIAPRAGAVLDVEGATPLRDALIAAWVEAAGRMLEALGWQASDRAVRCYDGGMSLFLSAPNDQLYTATEVNEWAWASASAKVYGDPEPDFQEAVERLRTEAQNEANPKLIALEAAAAARGITMLADERLVSLGLGKHSRKWKTDQLPDPDEVPWQKLDNIPTAMITGTNGKTTTVRLLGAIARAAGLSPGISSTDWLMVGDRVVENGDYSGPGGARKILRHPRVEIAFLETARGGLLRRGLVLEGIEAALVTNVAADHLGEYGIHRLDELTKVKLLVANALKPGGFLVLNAEDENLVHFAQELNVQKIWFALSPEHLAGAMVAGGHAVYVEDGVIQLRRGGAAETILPIERVPITFGGAARHNLANVLGAVGVAAAMGIPNEAIRVGLEGFKSTPAHNPGRCNLYELGGVRFIVDFAHNAHGWSALADLANHMPSKRRLVVLAQAGDRDDASIEEMCEVACRVKPTAAIVKEIAEYARGRDPKAVADAIKQGLRKQGMSDDQFIDATTDVDALRRAVAWAQAGDLILLVTHVEREKVFRRLEKMQQSNWQPGQPIPKLR